MADDGEKRDHLTQSVEVRQEREDRWKREGERPIWRNLSMLGSFGWLIVVPILLGALLGTWLDRKAGSGVFWSGSLIFAGAVIGFSMVWRRIKREDK